MATVNFYYKNRCIVVTNEDCECDNVPAYSEYLQGSLRDYPSHILDDAEFDFWDVAITRGYYEGACIDYMPKTNMYGQDMVTSRMRYAWNYESVHGLVKDFVEEFRLSEYRVKKIIGKLNECKDLVSFAERAMERVHEYLSEREEVKVNKWLDELKKAYGYDEYAVSARFSNGKTWYAKI